MGAETGIAWTDHTFNPWWGCTRVSPGCTNCYAEAWAARWKFNVWGPKAERRFFGEAHWNEPRKWNASARERRVRERVFCASMADVFEDRDDLNGERLRLWQLIEETPWLDWQLLTKRPQNITKILTQRWLDNPRPNVWLGTTVEDQERADERIPHLLQAPAVVRFLSCEPLLGPVDLDLMALDGPVLLTRWSQLHWIIVGGESGGMQARHMALDWARSLVNQCRAAGVKTFVKQLGFWEQDDPTAPARIAAFHGRGGNDKGGDPAAWPVELRVREFPR